MPLIFERHFFTEEVSHINLFCVFIGESAFRLYGRRHKMEDSTIIRLYFERSEAAITETDSKYGSFCRYIAFNILGTKEDAEECVNDTYLAAWNNIPPYVPNSLRTFLGRITRNMSVSRRRASRAKKRSSGADLLFDELDECIPSGDTVQRAADTAELTAIIERWLDSLSSSDRALFVRRYWFCETVNTIAEACSRTPNNTAQKLSRLRKSLRARLEKEGVSI